MVELPREFMVDRIESKRIGLQQLNKLLAANGIAPLTVSVGDDACWDTSGLSARIRARRIWEMINGPIPGALCVCHHCDRPRCGRPSHLYLATTRINLLDARQRGRFRVTHLAAARKKIGDSKRGVVYSQEVRDRMAAAQRGRKHSEETKAKIAAANVGHVHTQETREKMIEVAKLRKRNSKGAFV